MSFANVKTFEHLKVIQTRVRLGDTPAVIAGTPEVIAGTLTVIAGTPMVPLLLKMRFRYLEDD